MLTLRIFSFALFWIPVVGCTAVAEHQSDSKPVSHEKWNALLKKYVDSNGLVDYQGFLNDSLNLNEYLDLLKQHHPNKLNWTENERLAYWINAYNAFTIQLIIRNYPVASIREIAGKIPFINSAWDLKFIEIEGALYDLNNIEHGIIRKRFNEPRIHFALVCAALSCPRLRNEAYTALQLDTQLEEAAFEFFNDTSKNNITPEHAELSLILKWYSGDFISSETTLRDYVNRYSAQKLGANADIDYMDYNWSLNTQ